MLPITDGSQITSDYPLFAPKDELPSVLEVWNALSVVGVFDYMPRLVFPLPWQSHKILPLLLALRQATITHVGQAKLTTTISGRQEPRKCLLPVC